MSNIYFNNTENSAIIKRISHCLSILFVGPSSHVCTHLTVYIGVFLFQMLTS